MHRRAKVWKETSWNERCLIRDKSSHSSHQFTNKTENFFYIVAHLLVENSITKGVKSRRTCVASTAMFIWTTKYHMQVFNEWTLREPRKKCEVHLEHFHLFEICVFEKRNKFRGMQSEFLKEIMNSLVFTCTNLYSLVFTGIHLNSF